jgi:hypothetical protein
MKSVIVFTTINAPKIARFLCENIEKFGHKKETGIIIIGDKKSPNEESFAIAKELRQAGFDVSYFDIALQEKWLEKFPKLKEIIPYNSDNRRNIGYLMAKERGAEVILSLDDDNFPLPEIDLVGGHIDLVGKEIELPVVSSESRWFNVGDLLENKKRERLFPRGFPYGARQEYDLRQKTIFSKKVKIMLNEGLWVGEPDIDAITRLERNAEITGLKNYKTIALDIGTFSPINSQNTAFHAAFLPAYYFVLMGEVVDGLKIDRYGDIWQGLFTKKVMDTMGVYASFGVPLVNHLRNIHNHFKDLKEELNAIIYTEILAEFLLAANLKKGTPSEIYAALAEEFLNFAIKDNRCKEDFRAYVKKINYCQKVWLECCEKLN